MCTKPTPTRQGSNQTVRRELRCLTCGGLLGFEEVPDDPVSKHLAVETRFVDVRCTAAI